jgi:hypothetical protein
MCPLFQKLGVARYTVFTFLVLNVSPFAFADTKELLIPQRTESPYQVGDFVCTEQAGSGKECGKVVSSGSDFIRVSIEPETDGVEIIEKVVKAAPAPIEPHTLAEPAVFPQKPEPVTLAEPAIFPQKPEPFTLPEPAILPQWQPPSCERKLASIAEHTAVESAHIRNEIWYVAAGTTFGSSYYNLFGKVERPLDREIDLGLSLTGALGSSYTKSVSAFGITVYGNYWESHRRDGLVFSPAIMAQYISANPTSTTGKYSSLATVGPALTAGFRWKVSEMIELTPRGGVVYPFRIAGDPDKVKFSGVQPFVTMEAGFGF